MPNPSPYANYSRDQLEKEAMRNQKILVALFLCLGKSVVALPLKKRNIEVTETEIRKAWSEQKSPVRILSEVRASSLVGLDPETGEGLYTGSSERVYKVLLQDLDLQKVGFMKNGQTCPPYEASTTTRSNVETGERRRVFDLE